MSSDYLLEKRVLFTETVKKAKGLPVELLKSLCKCQFIIIVMFN